ncbi:unnamed protein product [Polarella glacialis]|uniref:Uncharacterized protein n=1 Tax=Polarella glacialis TaxID=89957 RepID=A0A813M0B4_POLGL|nr:unnamed protein product [Polarella glacialis]
MRCLQQSCQLVSKTGHLPLIGIESPNCSDALELPGRWDAEVAAPHLLTQSPGNTTLSEAVQEYGDLTAAILVLMDKLPAEQRVSSMSAEPRFPRYQAMM